MERLLTRKTRMEMTMDSLSRTDICQREKALGARRMRSEGHDPCSMLILPFFAGFAGKIKSSSSGEGARLGDGDGEVV